VLAVALDKPVLAVLDNNPVLVGRAVEPAVGMPADNMTVEEQPVAGPDSYY
jgi:hypothetical protein